MNRHRAHAAINQKAIGAFPFLITVHPRRCVDGMSDAITFICQSAAAIAIQPYLTDHGDQIVRNYYKFDQIVRRIALEEEKKKYKMLSRPTAHVL